MLFSATSELDILPQIIWPFLGLHLKPCWAQWLYGDDSGEDCWHVTQLGEVKCSVCVLRPAVLWYSSGTFDITLVCYLRRDTKFWQWISLWLHYQYDASLGEQQGWNTAKRLKLNLKLDCEPLLWVTQVFASWLCCHSEHVQTAYALDSAVSLH